MSRSHPASGFPAPGEPLHMHLFFECSNTSYPTWLEMLSRIDNDKHFFDSIEISSFFGTMKRMFCKKLDQLFEFIPFVYFVSVTWRMISPSLFLIVDMSKTQEF